jgi:hypothetical protein
MFALAAKLAKLTQARQRSRKAPIRRRPARPSLEALEQRDVPTTFTTLQLHQAAEYMLTVINDIRANPSAAAAQNGIDLNEGLPAGTISTAAKQPLAMNPQLMAAIEGHMAVYLNSSTFWSDPTHVDPHSGLGDGSPGSRITAQG